MNGVEVYNGVVDSLRGIAGASLWIPPHVFMARLRVVMDRLNGRASLHWRIQKTWTRKNCRYCLIPSRFRIQRILRANCGGLGGEMGLYSPMQFSGPDDDDPQARPRLIWIDEDAHRAVRRFGYDPVPDDEYSVHFAANYEIPAYDNAELPLPLIQPAHKMMVDALIADVLARDERFRDRQAHLDHRGEVERQVMAINTSVARLVKSGMQVRDQFHRPRRGQWADPSW